MPTRISVTTSRSGRGWICEVAVNDQRGSSRHTVGLSPEEIRRYGRGRSPEQLVRASFEFLLEREPPAAILPRFDLAEIERYFPEFPDRV